MVHCDEIVLRNIIQFRKHNGTLPIVPHLGHQPLFQLFEFHYRNFGRLLTKRSSILYFDRKVYFFIKIEGKELNLLSEHTSLATYYNTILLGKYLQRTRNSITDIHARNPRISYSHSIRRSTVSLLNPGNQPRKTTFRPHQRRSVKSEY